MQLPPKVTNRAFERLAEIMPASSEKGLRVAVEGGGCSGFQDNIELDTKHEDDLILEKEGNEIKISNINLAVNEEVKTLNCKKESKKGCNNKSTKCITHNLWDQLDQHINNFFEKVKLQDLVKGNQIPKL